MNKALETERLLPCPFCGSADIDPTGWANSDGVKGPACNGCGASAGGVSKTTDENIAAWNRRALHKESFDAGWEQAKLLLKPEDLSQAERGGEVVAWRWETESEHIARDMAEGRFPERSSRIRVRDAAPQPSAAIDEAKLLKVLRDESWDLRCFSYPTGGDDYDIGWRVIGHWMAEPKERVIAEIWKDDPAAAIREAIESQARAALTAALSNKSTHNHEHDDGKQAHAGALAHLREWRPLGYRHHLILGLCGHWIPPGWRGEN